MMADTYPAYSTNVRKGWIEIICGSMFSGKTEELLRRLRRAHIARQKVLLFKPRIDTRYDQAKVVSHDASEWQSIPISAAKEILNSVQDEEVIGIDEVQFLDKEIIMVCNELANKGMRVIAAGLDKDYCGNPFGPMPALMAIAEYVTKVHAVCVRCGSPANFSHRLIPDTTLIMLGEKDQYEPLCRECFNVANAALPRTIPKDPQSI